MDHYSSAAQRRLCAAQAAPARDIGALAAAFPEARFLDADADTLALILPQFETATATTTGSAVLLSERGGYAQPRMAGGRLPSPPGRIALRLAAGRGEQLAYSPADPDRQRPAALHLFDATGQLAHRALIAAPADLAMLAALIAELPTRAEPANPAPAAQTVPSLPAIRRARDTWGAAELASHIDDLLLDGGRTRRTCLPHLGINAARRTDPLVIGHLLREFARRQSRFRRLAVRTGCVQTQEGPLGMLRPEGDLLLMGSGTATMAIDLSSIAEIWITRLGPAGSRASALELYDSDGDCAAALLPPSQASAAEAAEWENLLGSLPAASATATFARPA